MISLLFFVTATVQLVMGYNNWLAYFFFRKQKQKQKKGKKKWEEEEEEKNEAKGRTYDDLLVVRTSIVIGDYLLYARWAPSVFELLNVIILFQLGEGEGEGEERRRKKS